MLQMIERVMSMKKGNEWMFIGINLMKMVHSF